ncbi:major facilitator superfamily domain-containing protein [Zalerion maritima]|uniref:Major facilitator superfamily domain-containing protein n=1 Tax=Zalerion maritima TaxID=339359 RepID=A0AAD5S3B9_9PEZI|nr:major facilitator superfamily domain-containing protein [Zalerion maritima]
MSSPNQSDKSGRMLTECSTHRIGDPITGTVVGANMGSIDADLLREAAARTQAEHSMGLLESLKLYGKAVFWSMLISSCIIMEGFDIAFLNNLYAYPPFQRKFGIIGLHITGWFSERYGYRKTLIFALGLISCFIFIIFFSESLNQLFAGEVLAGIPWGGFQTLATVYASDLQDPFALQWMWPIPLLIGIFLAPESPRWLVCQERAKEATNSLRRLTSRKVGEDFKADETIAMMVHTNAIEKQAEEGARYIDCFKGINLRRTEIVDMTWALQTLCGSTFMEYSTYFFEQAGLEKENASSMTLGLYSVGIVGTVAAWVIMNWAGRRTLYFGGEVVMCIILLAICFAGLAGRDSVEANGRLERCFWCTPSFTTPPLESKTMVLARNAYNIVGIISNLLTPKMLNPTAWSWGAKTAFFWAGSCFFCVIWTYFRLPELKGRTYGEIEILFENKISTRKFKSAKIEGLEGAYNGYPK